MVEHAEILFEQRGDDHVTRLEQFLFGFVVVRGLAESQRGQCADEENKKRNVTDAIFQDEFSLWLDSEWLGLFEQNKFLCGYKIFRDYLQYINTGIKFFCAPAEFVRACSNETVIDCFN